MAFDPIHLHKYFHICIYFIHQVIACFSKHAARAIATLAHNLLELVVFPQCCGLTRLRGSGIHDHADKGVQGSCELRERHHDLMIMSQYSSSQHQRSTSERVN